jgi:hypothetical protein
MAVWQYNQGNPNVKYYDDVTQFVGQTSIDKQLAIYIRETCANSLDAKLASTKKVILDFELSVYSGDEKRSILKKIGVVENLINHYKAVKDNTRSDFFVKDPIDFINDQNQKLYVLDVTDYYTSGLTGPEYDTGSLPNDARFIGLCKSILGNIGDGVDKTGSFGLGKFVHWRFNYLKMVMIYSKLSTPFDLDGEEINSRLFGISRLADHHLNGKTWDGTITFGEDAGDLGTKSMCNTDADEFASQIGFPNFGDKSGTSIKIIGFNPEETSESGSEYNEEEIIGRLKVESAKYFWPAIADGRIDISVSKKGEKKHYIDPRKYDYLVPFIRFYENIMKNKAKKLCEELKIKSPTFHHNGKDYNESEGMTIVAARRQDRDVDLLNYYAFMRGSGMVINYSKIPGAEAVGGNPSIGIVLTGNAVPDWVDEYSAGNQQHLETFVSFSEPVVHDKWNPSERRLLKITGGKNRITNFKRNISNTFRKLVQVGSSESAGSGMTPLGRMIRIGGAIGGQNKTSEISVSIPDKIEKRSAGNKIKYYCVVYIEIPKKLRLKTLAKGKKATHFQFSPNFYAVDEGRSKIPIKSSVANKPMVTFSIEKSSKTYTDIATGVLKIVPTEYSRNSLKYSDAFSSNDEKHKIQYVSNAIPLELSQIISMGLTYDVKKAIES